ncbi:MAG: hypothetical protein PUD25_00970 [Bacilli bacterium]|nr:hypothetical protein [Bacilli bacterium]
MEIQKRVSDISKVVDSQWNANHNYNQIREANEKRQQHFNKMFNIKDKKERDKEILEANSIEGRLKRLEGNMQASKGNELFRNRNNFR